MPKTSKFPELLSKAKIAEQAERYEDMVEYMRQISSQVNGDELTEEERNLISVGYKNLMAQRRTSWRIAESFANEHKGDSDYEAYRDMIAEEVRKVIEMVITDVVQRFTEGDAAATEVESLVFFKKMEGDYYRYGAETSKPDNAKYGEFLELADQAYSKAQELAKQDHDNTTSEHMGMKWTSAIWLGLGLNQSVFLYEIKNEAEKAKALAQEHFDEALKELDTVEEPQYKDATLIMQLLKDNLTLWNDDDHNDDMQVQDIDDN